MELIYVGPFPVVEVPEADFFEEFGTEVTKGEPVDVPDALAERLLEQDTWRLASNGAPTPDEIAAKERAQAEAEALTQAQAEIDKAAAATATAPTAESASTPSASDSGASDQPAPSKAPSGPQEA